MIELLRNEGLIDKIYDYEAKKNEREEEQEKICIAKFEPRDVAHPVAHKFKQQSWQFLLKMFAF